MRLRTTLQSLTCTPMITQNGLYGCDRFQIIQDGSIMMSHRFCSKCFQSKEREGRSQSNCSPRSPLATLCSSHTPLPDSTYPTPTSILISADRVPCGARLISRFHSNAQGSSRDLFIILHVELLGYHFPRLISADTLLVYDCLCSISCPLDQLIITPVDMGVR